MDRDEQLAETEQEMTRRRVLQAMGVGGAAGMFGGLLGAGAGCTSDDGRPRKEAAPQSSEPNREKRSFYLATGKIHADVKDLYLAIPGGSYDLAPLSTAGISTLKRNHPFAGRLGEPGMLTHAVHDVAAHAEFATAGYIYGKAPWGKVIVGSMLMIPTAQTRKWAKQYLENEKLAGIFHKHAMFKTLGLPKAAIPANVDEAIAASSLSAIPADTAISLIFKNVNFTNLVQAAETAALIASAGVSGALVQTISTLIENVGSYGELVDCVNPNDAGLMYLTPDTLYAEGHEPLQVFKPYFETPKTIMGQPLEDFPELAANMPNWTAQFRSQHVTSSAGAASAIQDATSLGWTEEFDALNPPAPEDYAGTTWRQNVVTPRAPVTPTTEETQQGTVSSVSLAPSRAPTASATANEEPSAGEAAKVGKIGEVTYQLTAHKKYGAWAELTGRTEAGLPKVRFFNNNIVPIDLYFLALDNQHPAQQVPNGNPWNKGKPDQGSPNDRAVEVGALSPLPCVLGIPVAWMFGQNYIDLNGGIPFPANAFSISLLFAGAGSYTKDGGWTDYWPDGTYKDYNNPTAPLGSGARLGTWIFVLGADVLLMLVFISIGIMYPYGIITNATVLHWVMTVNMSLGIGKGIVMQAIGLNPKEGAVEDVYGGASGNVAQIFGSFILPFAVGMVSWIWGAQLWAKFVANATKERLAELVPFVGEAMAAAAYAGDATNLALAKAQCDGMPTLFGQSLTRTTTWQVTISRDMNDNSFPKAAVKWRLIIHIRASNGYDQPLPPIEEPNFQPGAELQTVPIVIIVGDVPVGGEIKFEWECRTVNNQVVGKTVANYPGIETFGRACVNPGWMPNFPEEPPKPAPPSPTETCPVPSPVFGYVNFMMKEFAAPIHANSTMTVKGTTQNTGSGLAYAVVPNAGGSMATTACAAEGDMCSSGSISIGTVTGLVGFTYQAVYRDSDGARQTGWFVQQVGAAHAKQGATRIEKPYQAEPLLVYDKKGRVLTNGNNFLLEPIISGPGIASGHYVRKLDLKDNGLTFDPQAYWGQFQAPVNAVALHPAGLPLAVHAASSTLHILRQPPFASLVPEPRGCRSAAVFGGPGNANGLNPGLMISPIDIAALSTGVVLVLEQAAGRIQAFDTAGNPCKYFPNSSYYAQLKEEQTNVVYLGLDTDVEDMLWVLRYTGTGTNPSDFGVDIYNKSGEYVVTMHGINAHNFAIDSWRVMYTQNFTPITNAAGTVYLDKGAPVPSTTMLYPNTPE